MKEIAKQQSLFGYLKHAVHDGIGFWHVFSPGNEKQQQSYCKENIR